MKVLIIDDHAVVRAGVAAVLREMASETVILQAGDTATGSALAGEHSDIDLVLLDLMLPDGSGMAALVRFGERHPLLPVVVFSASESVADVRRALDLGALGYVPKSSSPSTLVAALKLVLEGEIYVPAFVMRSHPNDGAGVGPQGSLTRRQTEVLALIIEGLANKQIAHRLGLSEKTVKAHVTAVLRALNVKSRAQVAGRGHDVSRL